MLPLPPVPPEVGWRKTMRLPRDHYVRLDSNDYAVHPAVVGRRIEVHADLNREWVTCEGAIVADHPRVWAQHQTITDFEHTVAAKHLRHGSAYLLRPVTDAMTGQEVVRRLVHYPVLVIDEVGYIPFEREAASLFFQLVSSRYERASLIVTSNKDLARWGEVFGGDTVAAAMIDRLVHHAEVNALKGDSYRLKNRELGLVPVAVNEEN
jgi:hypothetical protein